ncbi:unnamed protein product [Prorocentrum cordatum]|uniref:SREBP regulating gene protein n=1 Tax=Prorocentrum cordatum TaxID=2364126 RepID=A0ABN9TA09_9DINO|nr:unnamed protein product [Polarella glacialis]
MILGCYGCCFDSDDGKQVSTCRLQDGVYDDLVLPCGAEMSTREGEVQEAGR